MTTVWIILGAIVVVGMTALLSYRAPLASQALVRTGMGPRKVTLDSMIALPILHKCTAVDLSVSRLALSFRGPENPLISKDEQLFDLEVVVLYRIPTDPKQIEQAIDHFGLDTLNHEPALVSALHESAENAIRAAAGEYSWLQVRDESEPVKAHLCDRLAILAPGLVVDDLAFDHLDKFPPEISARQGSGLLYREL